MDAPEEMLREFLIQIMGWPPQDVDDWLRHREKFADDLADDLFEFVRRSKGGA